MLQPDASTSSRRAGTLVVTALACYWFSSVPVFLAVEFIGNRIPPAPSVSGISHHLIALANWDGASYVDIAQNGYRYASGVRSNVVFMPAFPLLGRWLGAALGVDADAALALVANICLAAAFVVLAFYLDRGGRDVTSSLLALAVFPTGFFFRMAYSESLFLLLVLLVLYGLQNDWPLVAIAAVAGLATATRVVGVALLPVVALAVWRRSPNLCGFVWRWAALAPVACWGLLAYMVFLWSSFGDPFVFAANQEQWVMGPHVGLQEKSVATLTLEPFWTVYDSNSPAYWKRFDLDCPWYVSLQFANPVYLTLAAALTFVGWRFRRLSCYEALTAAMLLIIPYIAKSSDNCMASMGRFAAVVAPLYIVLGEFLCARRRPLRYALLLTGFVIMLTYAVLFASWHWFI